jgi:hypothetical protein
LLAPSFELLLVDGEQVHVFAEDRVDASDCGVIKKVRASCSVLRCSCASAKPSSIRWATMGKALIGCQLGDMRPGV